MTKVNYLENPSNESQ